MDKHANLPMTDGQFAWQTYWAEQGQAWRTEPEIDERRQEELLKQLLIVSDVQQGHYPFRDMQLSRADIEWLLARQSVDAGKEGLRQKHEFLDLRGANMRHVDLRNLPLARILGEITPQEWLKHPDITEEQQMMAIVHLEEANLRGAHLEGARLGWARLEKADLRYAHLEDANLAGAHLEGANMSEAHLEHAIFSGAHLKGAYLWKTHLIGANLRGIYLDGAYIGELYLTSKEHVGPRMVDIRWGDVNLAMIDWSQMHILGEEHEIKKKHRGHAEKKRALLLYQYTEAVRANRQVAIVLAAHGLLEHASHFGYRAQHLQRMVLKLQNKWGQYFFSCLLDLLAGYGYLPKRSLMTYLLVISLFSVAYAFAGHGLFSPLGAIVLSLSAFHGRGFFPTGLALDSPVPMLAAVEAVIGLLVEITFITTFTQRFFNRLGG